jgi:hypothetical protein
LAIKIKNSEENNMSKFKDKVALEMLKILVSSQIGRPTLKKESDNLAEMTDYCYKYAQSMCDSKRKNIISEKSNYSSEDKND